ncbi:MAG: threonine--tRNA ligase [Bryobacteraceae bacterium]|jgi:threonyl-tRNA synthetase
MSSSYLITLPDGSRKEVLAGASPLEVARSIGARLADDAVVARVDGKLWDLARPFEGDATLEILTSRNGEEALKVYRHSTAHLLAAAVLELYPGTRLGVGPAIESGFYYDFERETPFTTEDLELIEKKMREIRDRDLAYGRTIVPKQEGLRRYQELGEGMKCELIEEKAGESFTEYTLGPNFSDFCLGPHVPSTKRLKAFKLLSVSGAYFKGDQTRQQLQRIYGTSFFTQKDLEEYLNKLEEAKRRDHRLLGKQLDLLSIQELAGPGLIFFHPKGALIRKLLEDWMREQYLARGYSLVSTPHIARESLWQISGHLENYKESMFSAMELDDGFYRPKPMNCPMHILIYKDRGRSYRDLPVRLGELGTVYRYERSGTLHGLFRVRGFTQDDAHIFCTPEQIEDEITGCLQFAVDTLKTYGFDRYTAELSTWDGGGSKKYMGSAEQWVRAENALRRAAERVGLEVKLVPDEAAFYGPKIDVKLLDCLDRSWQLSTVQFDWNLPQRFDLEYIGSDNEKHQPVMVHRALYGSVERFFGILLEHYAGAFPVWLAPVQAIVLPIADRHNEYARTVLRRLEAEGFRAEIDERSEKVNYKIREAQLTKIPYMLVIGDREASEAQVAVRNRKHGDQGAQSLDQFVAGLKTLVESKAVSE